MEGAGRQLLAQSDDRYNFYKNSDQCKGSSSLMVCKSCTASNLAGVALSTEDGGFQIWCFNSGDITNNVSSFWRLTGDAEFVHVIKATCMCSNQRKI